MDHRENHNASPPASPKPGLAQRFVRGLIRTLRSFCIILGVLFVLGLLGSILAERLLTGSSAHADRGVDEFPDMRTVWSYGEGNVVVARIGVRGPIIRAQMGGLFSLAQDPVTSALRMIRAAQNDPSIKAIILEIDSPGGGITASDVIYKALMDFRASDSDRRIVALFEDVAASGGYYIATAANHIVAHPTTITGSIGVLISSLNLKEFGDKYGIRDTTIKSGANKDMLNPWADLTDEQRELLQAMIDQMHTRFVDLVALGRGLEESKVREIADGRILSAQEALRHKLIDEIGYWSDAMASARKLLGADAIRVVRYEQRFSLSSFLKGFQRLRVAIDPRFWPRSRMMYMWSL
tara:strand:+ start:4167 stop:5222 length:1056 start_codon:yes stop_codon:yes gene_type:complete